MAKLQQERRQASDQHLVALVRCRPASVQLTPPAAAAPSSSGLPSAEVELRFTAVVAFNRPVVGSQALQSLAGMLRSSGLTAGGSALPLLLLSAAAAAATDSAAQVWPSQDMQSWEGRCA